MSASGPRSASAADQLVSDLLPENLDWERLVRSYPLPALGLAALGGYWLGRTRGSAVVAALGAFAAAAAVRGVNEALGEDVL
jgi:hypothetical protein